MQYLFYEVDRSIRALCRCDVLVKDDAHQDDTELARPIVEQLESLRSRLVAIVANHVTPEGARLFVDQHSRALSDHANVLHAAYRDAGGRSSGPKTDRQREIFSVCEAIESLLNFMFTRFPAFVDRELPLPFTSHARLRKSFRATGARIQSEGVAAGIDPGLFEVLLRPFNHLCDYQTWSTFRMARYLELIGTAILDMYSHKKDNLDFEIHYILHEYNFNFPEYLRYCSLQIERKTADQTPNKRLEIFSQYIKTMNQVPRREAMAFDPALESTVSSNSKWFRQAREYQEALIKIERGYIDGVQVAPNNRKKLRLNMPVRQVAAFSRSFWEAGAIDGFTLEETIDWFADNVATKDTEEMSRKSIRSKLYAIGQPATVGVIKLLLKCVSKLRRY